MMFLTSRTFRDEHSQGNSTGLLYNRVVTPFLNCIRDIAFLVFVGQPDVFIFFCVKGYR